MKPFTICESANTHSKSTIGLAKIRKSYETLPSNNFEEKLSEKIPLSKINCLRTLTSALHQGKVFVIVGNNIYSGSAFKQATESAAM